MVRLLILTMISLAGLTGGGSVWAQQNPEDLFKKGVELYDQLFYKEAIDSFTEALAARPDFAKAYEQRGWAYYSIGRFEESAADFSKVIELTPDNPYAYRGRGVVLAEKGRIDEAIADFGKAISLEPGYRYALMDRGAAYLKQNKYDQAITDFTAVLDKTPGDFSVLYQRGLARQAKGDLAGAAVDFREALAQRPEQSLIKNKLAEVEALQKASQMVATKTETQPQPKAESQPQPKAEEEKPKAEQPAEKTATAAESALKAAKVADTPAPGERRVALVMGNSAYDVSPLKNPANDARLIGEKLRQLSFEVIEKTDLTQNEMKLAIFDFGDRLRGRGGRARGIVAGAGGNEDTIGLFYYAGHGVQVDGVNYLIPVGARIASERHVKVEGVAVDSVLAEMEAAMNRLNIVILDACRNNPFKRSYRSAADGLAFMNAPSGTLIAYATAPGRTASDGEGDNGLYTEELARQITVEGLRIEDVFKRVRAAVQDKSNHQQTPWESSSLLGDFFFNR